MDRPATLATPERPRYLMLLSLAVAHKRARNGIRKIRKRKGTRDTLKRHRIRCPPSPSAPTGCFKILLLQQNCNQAMHLTVPLAPACCRRPSRR